MLATHHIGDILRKKLLVFDGAMGTQLYANHIFTNRNYDEVSLSNPELVSKIHNDYINAGADVITTNSFGANYINLRPFGLSEKAEQIAKAAAGLARKAADSCGSREIYVAGSVGPVGRNGVSTADAVAALGQEIKALIDGNVDFIMFETIPSRDDASYALQAMKEVAPDFPFVLSFSISDDEVGQLGNLFAPFPGMPVPEAIGLNCGSGPSGMLTVLEHVANIVNLPLIVQPNAGYPKMQDGRQLYLCSPEYLFTYAENYVNLGARGIGGCCGTTPEHTAGLARAIKPMANTTLNIKEISSTVEQQQIQEEAPLAERSALGRKLANKEWISMVEITPPLSWNASKLIEKARLCKEHGIDTLNVPDGPRASSRLSALVTAMLVQQQVGIETVLHVCCRDRNMIGLQADMLGAAACGLRNFLLITGDPLKLGNYQLGSEVFDTDSIGLVKLQKYLNRGVDMGGSPINPPTRAVVGVGANPNAVDFKREVRRIREKADAGADYITTQPCFDPGALFRFMDAISDVNLPVIAGIWPLISLRNAQFMRNEVPGVVVPDEIMERMAKHETREGQMAEGLKIARESVAAVRSAVAGVQVSAPFAKVDLVCDVLKAE